MLLSSIRGKPCTGHPIMDRERCRRPAKDGESDTWLSVDGECGTPLSADVMLFLLFCLVLLFYFKKRVNQGKKKPSTSLLSRQLPVRFLTNIISSATIDPLKQVGAKKNKFYKTRPYYETSSYICLFLPIQEPWRRGLPQRIPFRSQASANSPLEACMHRI